MKIILYSTGCPKCKILQKKLIAKGVLYTENNDTEEMSKLGISAVPVLSLDGKLLEYKPAVDWVNSI